MPRIVEKPAKTILTKQTGGFLNTDPYPFTHTLSAYTGCGFGKKSACGRYCYAQTLPNWQNAELEEGEGWGDVVFAKVNAAELLLHELVVAKERRNSMRIFMSPVTDPYQPLEAKFRLSRSILGVFGEFSDLDLLVIQTRSPLVEQDFDLIQKIPYAYISMTIETDKQDVITKYGGGVSIAKRFEVVKKASEAGIKTQIAVSPCLPHSDEFAGLLVASGADRFIIDSFSEGDGSRGARTAKSEFAEIAEYDWKSNEDPLALLKVLQDNGKVVNWSSEGFCSIPNRPMQEKSIYNPII